MEDWMLPNSSTQSIFSSMLGENIGSTEVSKSTESGFSFHGSHEHHASANPNYRNGTQNHTDVDQATRSWPMSEHQIGSNGCLLDRMASRAGFNTPVLNTETIRNGDFSQNWEVLSPYLTIPSGLSPTNLLESPAFASDSPYSKAFNLDGLLSDPNHLYAPPDKVAQSPPIDEEQDDEADPRGAEDGYNWRKYGQKQAKGSDSLQGYYKCSYSRCLVKKKVELSQEGHITEIIYKGSHNHPKTSPAHGSSHIGSSVAFNDNPDVASSATNTMLGAEYNNGATTFSYDEEDDENGTHGIVSVACYGDGDESESKKRKVDMSISGATRSVKDPKVVVQTTSEVDILDDGYKWRKYGQKVVKGNPNPRSYYKCTNAGCAVRKHVERASHNLNSVITTYEGKHNHNIPCVRNNNNHHVNSEVPSNNGSVQHRPEHSQLHNKVSQFQRPASFGLLTGPHLISPHDHLGYGMNQHWGLNQGQQYLEQPPYMNEMESTVQPKVELMYDSSLSLPNASAVYQQVTSRMPLGPQM